MLLQVLFDLAQRLGLAAEAGRLILALGGHQAARVLERASQLVGLEHGEMLHQLLGRQLQNLVQVQHAVARPLGRLTVHKETSRMSPGNAAISCEQESLS